jgi:hypothetical protein
MPEYGSKPLTELTQLSLASAILNSGETALWHGSLVVLSYFLESSSARGLRNVFSPSFLSPLLNVAGLTALSAVSEGVAIPTPTGC